MGFSSSIQNSKGMGTLQAPLPVLRLPRQRRRRTPRKPTETKPILETSFASDEFGCP